jgi:hypothetical protein
MKYYLYYTEYICKSPYPYWVVVSDEWLTHFEVWSRRKTFNATMYSEQRVLNLIKEKYPEAVRVERPIVKNRKKIEIVKTK